MTNVYGRLAITAMILIFVLSTMLTASTIFVSAQGQVTVVVLDSVGGTTNPAAGTYTYDDGAEVTLTATVDDQFIFVEWVVSAKTDYTSTDNPFTLTVASGNDYMVQAVFQPAGVNIPPYQPPVNTSAYAVVRVLASVGGTTDPAPGLYGLVSASQLQLRAIPNNGFEFNHWVITGSYMPGHGGDASMDTNIPTDNPLTIGHGEGYEYVYQAVFLPIGSESPNPPPTNPPTTLMGISVELIIAIIAIIIAIVAVIASLVYVRRSHK
jgi:hypothetical protein